MSLSPYCSPHSILVPLYIFYAVTKITSKSKNEKQTNKKCNQSLLFTFTVTKAIGSLCPAALDWRLWPRLWQFTALPISPRLPFLFCLWKLPACPPVAEFLYHCPLPVPSLCHSSPGWLLVTSPLNQVSVIYPVLFSQDLIESVTPHIFLCKICDCVCLSSFLVCKLQSGFFRSLSRNRSLFDVTMCGFLLIWYFHYFLCHWFSTLACVTNSRRAYRDTGLRTPIPEIPFQLV